MLYLNQSSISVYSKIAIFSKYIHASRILFIYLFISVVVNYYFIAFLIFS